LTFDFRPKETNMRVAVFGSSQPKEGDAAYAEACQLGKMLAERGYVVLNGGYIGTMEAVSRGASEAGGHVIGVTCQDIEDWRGVGVNRWVKEEIKKKTLIERLQAIIEASDAAIALPGGPGTLTEISLTWNLMVIESRHRSPLILVGDGWQSVFAQVFEKLGKFTPESQRNLLQFAADVETALKLLENRE
jgi:uncharacterized protein (TIGR00725 family)